jgi:hypothetical protein
MSNAVETLFYLDNVLNLVDQSNANARGAGRARARFMSSVPTGQSPKKDILIENIEETTDSSVL